jgi:hypothetical protein
VWIAGINNLRAGSTRNSQSAGGTFEPLVN